MKKFFAPKGSSRAAIPTAKAAVGFEANERPFNEYFNQAIYEIQADYIIGTSTQVVNGEANVKIAAASAFQDIDSNPVTFVQGDRIAIIGHDALSGNIIFTADDLVFLMNPDVYISMGVYKCELTGDNYRGNLKFKNATTGAVIQGGTGHFLDIYAYSDSATPPVTQDSSIVLQNGNDGIINGNVTDYQLQLGKNSIVNPDFEVWFRGASFTAIASGSYSASSWKYVNTSTAVHDITKSSDVPTQVQSGHLSNSSLLVDCTTSDVSIAAGDYVTVESYVQGYEFKKHQGNYGTLSFWVKATKTGTYCASFRNSGNDRSYVAEYLISSSDVWEKKVVTLDFSDSSGLWNYGTGIGLTVSWALAAGTTYQTTADAWQTGNFLATSNQVNACDDAANNFRLSQVSFEVGHTATKFVPRVNSDEEDICRYYHERLDQNSGVITAGMFAGSGTARQQIKYHPKRVAPGFTFTNTNLQTWIPTASVTNTATPTFSSIGKENAQMEGGGFTTGGTPGSGDGGIIILIGSCTLDISAEF